MAASVEYRQEEVSSCETKVQENGNDLSLFVDFSGVNLNLDVLQKSNLFQEALDSESENPLIPDTTSIIHGQDSGAGDLLNSENNTSDYDWLLSPPRNLLEMENEKSFAALISNSPDSSLEKQPKLTTSTTSKLPSSTNVLKSSNAAAIRKPKTSSTPTSRVPLAPAKRSITTTPRLPAATSAPRSSTPTARSASRSSTPTARSASRSSTPTARPSITARSASRSSTPTARPSITARSASRSSTPTARPSITARSASRSSTPTARPSITARSASRSSTPTARPTIISSKPTSRSSTPSVKSRPSKNPPSQPNVKLDITETNIKAVPKRTSCSPSRGQVSVKSGVMKKYSNGNDDVNPVLMGTKMVERVVNMRKLAPPKEHQTSGKLSVSQDNSGFGRSLSKKSFDMALRHLDIRRSMPGNVRAMITKVPASSVYSVRSESMKGQTIDSALATSSSASSENGNSYSQ